ncbi:MAG: ECF transporter S component [Clostridia bacterium]|nr:ECF transporter S component [Clostridia bacterium]
MAKTNITESTKKLVLASLLTALVIVFHIISQFVTIGAASLNLCLVPIVIGAALCGPIVSSWLGFVNAVAILLTPSTALFYGWHILGTIVTVLLKGTLCGTAAGLIYKALEKVNKTVASIVAAVACPIVNTGIFILGSVIFFKGYMTEFFRVEGSFTYFIIMFVIWNFVFEFSSCILLAPTITKVIDIKKK